MRYTPLERHAADSYHSQQKTSPGLHPCSKAYTAKLCCLAAARSITYLQQQNRAGVQEVPKQHQAKPQTCDIKLQAAKTIT